MHCHLKEQLQSRHGPDASSRVFPEVPLIRPFASEWYVSLCSEQTCCFDALESMHFCQTQFVQKLARAL